MVLILLLNKLLGECTYLYLYSIYIFYSLNIIYCAQLELGTSKTLTTKKLLVLKFLMYKYSKHSL